MMNVQISIIMPIYNAENYLKKSIESVLNQTFKNFELILINDGSKDRSLDICNEYKKTDKRVVVISQENMGLCAARNKGLLIAKGKYITFIDNDDEYDENLLNDNYKYITKYDVDIVKFGYVYLKGNNYKERVNISIGKNMILSGDEKKNNFIKIHKAGVLTYVWDGMFKKSFLDNERLKFRTDFKNGHEDRVFMNEAYLKCDNFFINNNCYYYHYCRKGSTSGNYNPKHIDNTLELVKSEKSIYDAYMADNSEWNDCLYGYVIYLFSYLSRSKSIIKYKKLKNIWKTFYDMFSGNELILNYSSIKDVLKSLIWFAYCKKLYFLLSIFVNINIVIRNLKRG